MSDRTTYDGTGRIEHGDADFFLASDIPKIVEDILNSPVSKKYQDPDPLDACESPIESEFANHLLKHLRDDLALEAQVEVKALGNKFRLDFVVRDDCRIAFECDGREFHEDFRDEVRDALLLGEDCVDVVYHIDGSFIHYHLYDLLYLISQWDGKIFSERGKMILSSLRSEFMRSDFVNCSDKSCYILGGSFVRRRTRIPSEMRPKEHWRHLHKRAREHSGKSFSELMELLSSQAFG